MKTGAQADARNLPGFAETRAEVQAAIDAAGWLQETDKLMLEILIRELHIYRHADDAHAKMGDVALSKRLNVSKLQLRRVRVLTQLAAQMGFTATSRYKVGLTQARTARELQGAVPVRSEERALHVAQLLQASGALPPLPPPAVDAEVVDDDEPTPPDLKMVKPRKTRKVVRHRVNTRP
jgi:hypothetical protein